VTIWEFRLLYVFLLAFFPDQSFFDMWIITSSQLAVFKAMQMLFEYSPSILLHKTFWLILKAPLGASL
jgi:hypothetical protein